MDLGFVEQLAYLGQGQADDVGIGTIDLIDESRSPALYAIGTGFVQRFPRSDIGFDFLFTQSSEPDFRFDDLRVFLMAIDQSDARIDGVFLSGQFP